MRKIKTENIRKLKKSHGIKRAFYPFLLLLEFLGIRIFFSGLIDSIVRKAGVNRSQNIFFRYKSYAKIFRDDFTKKKVEDYTLMIPSMLGANSNLTLLNLALAKYGSSRGHKPFMLVCDSAVPVCSKERTGKTRKNNAFFCHECKHGYKHLSRQTGMPVYYFSEFIGDEESVNIISLEKQKINQIEKLQGCLDYRFDNTPLGNWAKKSVLRYFLTGEFYDTKNEIIIYKKFLESSVIEYLVLKNCLNRFSGIRKMIFNNGTLLFEKIAGEMALKRKIDFISYETFIGKESVIFKRNEEIMNLNWEEEERHYYAENPWKDEMMEFADQHFEAIERGKDMYALLNKEHKADRLKHISDYAVLFTNLNFDTAVIDKHTVFTKMRNWIFEVMDYWQKEKPPLYLVIRIHPGELKLKTASLEFMGELINSRVKTDKIIVIDAHEEINSYELIKDMKFGLIYSSTIGLEIAHRNKACLVAGKPFFLNKSFVISPASREDYFAKLSGLCRGESFVPDREELYRMIYHMYGIRNQRLKGFQTRTPDGSPVTLYDSSDELLKENNDFLEFLFSELEI